MILLVGRLDKQRVKDARRRGMPLLANVGRSVESGSASSNFQYGISRLHSYVALTEINTLV